MDPQLTAQPSQDPSMVGHVFIVDDDALLCELQQKWLEDAGYRVTVFHDAESCLAGFKEALPDTVCLDLAMPGLSGLDVLARIQGRHPQLRVIVITAHTDVQTAVTAMKAGAWDYLVKPVERTKLLAEIRNAVEQTRMSATLAQLRREAEGKGYPGIVGSSPGMKALFNRLDRIAPSDITVLVQGESGTGKELVARAIHEQSARRAGPFVPLNCAAIPESLQESELFGHEKGAFTGATARRAGAFERADGGTLFLDEIGELSPSLQAKLLRSLQERRFHRVGGSAEVASDFRLVAATHRDLPADVRAGRFREDLYYRIAVMELEIPPLRDRAGDIALLAQHFLDGVAEKMNYGTPQLSDGLLEALTSYRWPGNVRELENAIERAVVESGGGPIRVTHLPQRMRSGRDDAAPSRGGPGIDSPAVSSGAPPSASAGHEPQGARTLDQVERDAIAAALERHQGNLTGVVRELGIGRTTLYRKLKKYRLR